MSVTIDYGGVPTEIYRRLRDRILKGHLNVGDQIKIDAVAKEFGVSIIPVREAMRILAADHLIEIQPRRSPVVSGIAPGEALEIGQIRLALEPVALAAAVPNHSDKSLNQCQKILDKSRTNKDDWQNVELNREFHLALYEPCGMSRLIKVISDQYDGLTRCAHFMVVRSGSGQAKSYAEHLAILDACRSGDLDVAIAQLTTHLEASISRLRLHFQNAEADDGVTV